MSRSLFDLSNRVALVTGGGRGMGRNIASALASAGASLLLVGRDAKTLATAQRELIQACGHRVEIFPADLASRDALRAMGEAGRRLFGHVDIIVHNAGISSNGTVFDFEDEDWDRVMRTNLEPAAWLTREFAADMAERGWGRIIFISSAAALRAVSGHATYSSSKSALHGFARAAAVELGRHGVTVNCIAPGVFLTDMARSSGEAAFQAMADMSAVKRMGDVREMEGPVLLLASDAGSFITGQVIAVDGGLTIRN